MTRLGASLQQVDRTWVLAGKRKLIYFGGCDYFRLASHPKVLQAFEEGAWQHGINVAASRFTTGNHPLYKTAEAALARFFRAPSAVLISSGYTANLVVAQAWAGQFTLALIDQRSHPSLRDAASFLGCPVREFKHRDPLDARRLVRGHPKQSRVAVLTDGLFAHDGSVAPLRRYLAVLPRDSWILVDDAHGAGVLGRHSRGSLEHERVSRQRVVQTITLSKAFGVYGGAVLVPMSVRHAIVARSRLFSGQTPLPLPVVTASLQALEIVGQSDELRTRLIRNSTYLKVALRRSGWPLPEHPGPIIPFLPQSKSETARLKRNLLAAQIYPPFIRYPGGPEAGYFRFVISSEHTREQLDRLLGVLQNRDRLR